MLRYATILSLITLSLTFNQAMADDITKLKKIILCGIDGLPEVPVGVSTEDKTKKITISGVELNTRGYDEFVKQLATVGVTVVDFKAIDEAIKTFHAGHAKEAGDKVAGVGAKMDAATADPTKNMTPEQAEAYKKYQAGGGSMGMGMAALPPVVKLPPGTQMPDMSKMMPQGMGPGGMQAVMAKHGAKIEANTVAEGPQTDPAVSEQAKYVRVLCQFPGQGSPSKRTQDLSKYSSAQDFYKLIDQFKADGYLLIKADYTSVDQNTTSMTTGNVKTITTSTTAIPSLQYMFEYYDKDGNDLNTNQKPNWRIHVENGKTVGEIKENYFTAIPKGVAKCVDKLYK